VEVKREWAKTQREFMKKEFGDQIEFDVIHIDE
jgi:hypothetical protein